MRENPFNLLDVHMRHSFSIQPQFLGKPLTLNVPPDTNPFGGLPQMSLPRTGDDRKDRLLRQAGEATRDTLAVTVVGPSQVDITLLQKLQDLQSGALGQRTENNGLFVVYGPQGEHLFYSTPQALRRLGLISIDGGGTYHAQLADMHAAVADLTDRHNKSLAQIIDVDEGGIIIETGYRGDFRRAVALHHHAKQKNGMFLCHAELPAAARAAQDKLEGAPVIALPRFHQLLTPALRGLGCKPVITCKNLLSHINPVGVVELAEIAHTLEAKQLVVSQSLAMTPTSNYFPETLRPRTETFGQMLFPKIISYLPGNYSDFVREFGAAIALAQATHTYMLVMQEVVFQHLRENLECVGSSLNQVASITATFFRDTSGAEAMEWAQSFHPELKTRCELSRGNKISLGPASGLVTKDSAIPEGVFRIEYVEHHVAFGKKPHRALPSSVQGGIWTERISGSTILPLTNRQITSTQLLDVMRPHQWLKFASRVDDNAEAMRHACGAGARSAVDIVFDLIGKTMNASYLRKMLVRKDEFIRAYATF